MKNFIESNVSFADSEILDYVRTGTTLRLSIRAWDGGKIHVHFNDVAGVEDRGLGDVSAFIQKKNPPSFSKRFSPISTTKDQTETCIIHFSFWIWMTMHVWKSLPKAAEIG